MSKHTNVSVLDHIKPEDVDRFWGYVIKSEGCWTFCESMRTRDGYGRMNVGTKTMLAHRLSWELNVGRIPEGICVCHNCPGGDNPACVRPDHLWLGTHLQNMQDMMAKGRHVASVGEAHGRAVLDEASVMDIRLAHSQGATIVYLAAKYGVVHAQVRNVVNGASWSHLPLLPRPTTTRACRITDAQVRDIRRRHAAGDCHRTIARDFCVSPSMVGLIGRRKSRKDVPEDLLRRRSRLHGCWQRRGPP